MYRRSISIITFSAILALLLVGCTNPLRKPQLNKVDREEDTRQFSYQNQFYDWVSQYTLTRWVNRTNWQKRRQLGIVRTESGWGLLGFDRNWIIQPGNFTLDRVVFHSHGSYPSNIYLRMNEGGRINLINSQGEWLASFERKIDPYMAINKVKSLGVYYRIEHGSVFSVYSNSNYDARSTLRTFVHSRSDFRTNQEWRAFKPTGECMGWMVQLRSGPNTERDQYWYVTHRDVYEITPDRRDYIRTTANRDPHRCVANFRIPPEDIRYYLGSNKQI